MLDQELHVAVLGKFHTVWFLGLLMWGIRVVKAFLKTLLGFVTVFFASIKFFFSSFFLSFIYVVVMMFCFGIACLKTLFIDVI